MKRVFGRKFFCCAGQRIQGNETNTSILSMIQANPDYLETHLVGANESLWDNDRESSTSPSSKSKRVFYRRTRKKPKPADSRALIGLRPGMKDVFNDINRKRDGRMTFAECYAYLERKGVVVDRSIAFKVFEMFDHSETGYLTLMEFCKLCPNDGDFARTFRYEVDRVENKCSEKMWKKHQKRRKDNDRRAEISKRSGWVKNGIPLNSFFRGTNDDSSSESVKLVKIQLPEQKMRESEDFLFSSDEDDPALATLYSRKTLPGIATLEFPKKSLGHDMRPSPPNVVRFVDEGSSDFGSPQCRPIEFLGCSSDEQEARSIDLLDIAPSNGERENSLRTTLWNGAFTEEDVKAQYAGKLMSKSQATYNSSVARSPDTSIGLPSPDLPHKPGQILVHIDYGMLENPSDIAIEPWRDVKYLKDLISKMKDTPAHLIRVHYRDCMLMETTRSLNQCGLEDHSNLVVQLAGDSPQDEAKRVFLNLKSCIKTKVTNIPEQYEAYVCYTHKSVQAGRRFKSRLVTKGWKIFDSENEGLIPTDFRTLTNALSRCTLFILFLTSEVLLDPWALLQILIACKLGKELVVINQMGQLSILALLRKTLSMSLEGVTIKNILLWSNVTSEQSRLLSSLELLYKDFLNPNKGAKHHNHVIQPHLEILNDSPKTGIKEQPADNSKASAAPSNVLNKPNFFLTKNRISTYKDIDRSRTSALTVEDIDAYLRSQELHLTASELANLFSSISTRKKETLSLSEFYKYCPPQGGFAEKVWETVIQRR